MVNFPTGPGNKILDQVHSARRNRLESKATDSALKQYLSFRLDNEWYAVEVAQLVEVLPPPRITRVPSVPAHILGVMNLRGEVLSVIDLKSFFGLDPGESSTEQAIVVVEHGDMVTGLLIDGIGDLVSLASEELSEEPLLPRESQGVFFEGAARWQGVLLTVVRLEGILESERMYRGQG